MRASDPLGPLSLSKSQGGPKRGAWGRFWSRQKQLYEGVLGFNVSDGNLPCHSSVLHSGANTWTQHVFFSVVCHRGSLLQRSAAASASPFICTEVERHKLTERESEAAAGQIITLSPTAVVFLFLFLLLLSPPLIFSPLPPPAPETR